MAVLKYLWPLIFLVGCYDLDYEPSDGVIQDQNEPPVVVIETPENGATATSPLVVTGVATDKEDGDLSSGIVWKADGTLIGVGASISPELTVGDHTLVASVADSEGELASSEITVTITNGGT